MSASMFTLTSFFSTVTQFCPPASSMTSLTIDCLPAASKTGEIVPRRRPSAAYGRLDEHGSEPSPVALSCGLPARQRRPTSPVSFPSFSITEKRSANVVGIKNRNMKPFRAQLIDRKHGLSSAAALEDEIRLERQHQFHIGSHMGADGRPGDY